MASDAEACAPAFACAGFSFFGFLGFGDDAGAALACWVVLLWVVGASFFLGLPFADSVFSCPADAFVAPFSGFYFFFLPAGDCRVDDWCVLCVVFFLPFVAFTAPIAAAGAAAHGPSVSPWR